MTTPLVNALKREIYIAGSPYRVIITAAGLTLAAKGAQKGVEYSWEELLKQRDEATVGETHQSSAPIAPVTRAVLAELAITVRSAATAIASADEKLSQAGALPQRLLESDAHHPVHNGARQEEHWFIEPLLTLVEVAAILQVSTRTARRLPIDTVPIGGEVRYLQSAVREYLRRSTVRTLDSRSWR